MCVFFVDLCGLMKGICMSFVGLCSDEDFDVMIVYLLMFEV